MAIAGYVLVLAVSVGLPVVSGILLTVRAHAGRAVVCGMACFTVFQGLIRLPLLQWVLPSFAGFLAFQAGHPVLYWVLAAFSAGIFEEGGRWLLFRRFLKNSRPIDALAFGIGHGGTEAFLLVGLNAVLLPWMGGLTAVTVSGWEFLLSGVERLLAMSAHLAWSVMVWRGVTAGKAGFLFAAVGSHGLFDLLPPVLMALSGSVWITEGAVAGMAAVLVIFMGMILHQSKKENRI